MIVRALAFLIAVSLVTALAPGPEPGSPSSSDDAAAASFALSERVARTAPSAVAAEAAARLVAALARAPRDANGKLQDLPYHPYEGRFTFARIHFNDRWGDLRRFGRRGRIGSSSGPGWSHDYPTAERNFSKILHEITFVRALLSEYGGNVLAWDDPRLFQFPVAYVSKPGEWTITEDEAKAVRNYLLKGGFVIFDDFGNDYGRRSDMSNLEDQMLQALPELRFLPLDGTEAIFDSFFEIDLATIDLPLYGGGPSIQWWGLFEDNDKRKRMLAIAGDNGDLGEYWEFSETGFYPVDLSNEAYKVGVNYIVYAMTH